MPDSSARVAVVGAAGFVGQRLCAHLKARGHDVTGVSRPYAAFLMERLGVRHLDTEAASVPRFDAVINLAYPTRGPGYTREAANRQIHRSIERLCSSQTKLIQVSSLAVFGFALDVPPSVGPVASRPDHEYVASKISMEHALTQTFGGGDFHIVRLGNVWGAACPNWVVGLIERLRNQQPVSVAGRTGWSNATEVGNVCDYLAFLLQQSAVRGTGYHHLAEFAQTPWTEFITPLARELGVTPVQVTTLPTPLATPVAELRAAVRALNVNRFIRGVMDARHTGAWGRAFFGRVPKPILRQLKKLKPVGYPSLETPLTPDDVFTLTVLAGDTLFAPAVHPRWTPAVSREESWRQVKAWMQHVGYV